MKTLTLLLAFALSSSAFAFGPGDVGSVGNLNIECAREATLAAMREVLNDRELRLSEMSGFGMSEHGVYLKSQTQERVTLTVMLGIATNGLSQALQVKVVLAPSYDNACQPLSATIENGQ